MAEHLPDEGLSQALQQAGVVSSEQIESARAAQTDMAQRGQQVSLGDVLIQQSVITPTIRENIERSFQARQAGGIKQLGPYKFIRKLGEGGMGAVFLAEDTQAGRTVAVKILPKKYSDDRQFLSRFRREAQSTGRLNHANIVCAYTVGEDQGVHYYAMEHCDGEPLDRLLKRARSIPWGLATGVILQVARGLKHAHEHGIIHRDIKPANVFICKPPGGDPSPAKGANPLDSLGEGYVAKILDLGLSKDLGGATSSFYTQTGMALGTPHYISPEQAKGEKQIDGRSDIYSLGVMFYHLVTGETPFKGSTAAIVMMKHITEELPSPQDLNDQIPDGVVHIIQRMMAKDPADRYQNCKELLEDLELVIDGNEPNGVALDADKSGIAMARRQLAAPAAGEGRLERGERGERRRTDGPVSPISTRRQALVGTEPVRPVGRRSSKADREGEPRAVGRKPLVLISAGGAVLLLAVILLLMIGRNDKPAVQNAPTGAAASGKVKEATDQNSPTPTRSVAERPAEKALAKATSGGTSPVVPVSPAIAAKPETAKAPTFVDTDERWKNAIDLLSLLDLSKDQVAGKWQRVEGGVQSDNTGDMGKGTARVQFPYKPPEEYDFRIAFTRVSGNSDVGQLLSARDRRFGWVMGSNNNTLFTFGGLSGDFFSNPSSVRREACLRTGQRHTSEVRVRRDGVKAYLDGTLVSQLATNYTDPIKNTYWGPRDPMALGLASFASPTAFHSAAVLELSGPGTFTRLDDPLVGKAMERQAKQWEKSPAKPQPSAPTAPKAEDIKTAQEWYRKGYPLDFQGKTDEALACYEKTLALNPNHDEAHFNRGLIRRARGDADEALDDFDKAVEFGGKSQFLSRYLKYRSASRGAKGDVDGAIKDLEKALTLDPKDPNDHAGLGCALFDVRRLPEARARLTRYLEMVGKKKDNAPYCFFRIWLTDLLEGKTVDEVRAKAKATRDEVKPDGWVGRLYAFFCGELDEEGLVKAAAAKDIKVQNGNLCEAYYHAAMVRLISGDTAGAKNLFNKCIATGRADFTEYASSKLELTRLK